MGDSRVGSRLTVVRCPSEFVTIWDMTMVIPPEMDRVWPSGIVVTYPLLVSVVVGNSGARVIGESVTVPVRLVSVGETVPPPSQDPNNVCATTLIEMNC